MWFGVCLPSLYRRGLFVIIPGMKKHVLLSILIVLVLLLASCQTSLSISYLQPSNINMASYRNVAVASAQRYEGKQSIPLLIRYMNPFDSSTYFYPFYSSYTFDSVNNTAADSLTRAVSKVFGESSYYSTLSPEKTDAYVSLYKVGRDPSAMLREDGVDALIIPKITSLKTDEYIDTNVYTDSYTKEVKVIYTQYRYVSLSFTLTVLDTATNRIVAVREYHTENVSSEVFDPEMYVFYSLLSENDLVSNAISSKISEIRNDFIPTRRYTYVTLKDNKPKDENVEVAYKAAENGNLDYALKVFEEEYEATSHVPSGYNAALILAANGDIERALEILKEIRLSGRDDSEVNSFYSELLELKAKNEEAMKQLSASSSSSSDSSGVSPYEYLF